MTGLGSYNGSSSKGVLDLLDRARITADPRHWSLLSQALL